MMPGVQFEEIWKALDTAYSKKSFQQMLLFRLNKDLDDFVADGSMRDMVFDLLSQAEREGWTTDLVREAYLYNARNFDLLKVYEKYHLAPAVSVQSGDDPKAREAQLHQVQFPWLGMASRGRSRTGCRDLISRFAARKWP